MVSFCTFMQVRAEGGKKKGKPAIVPSRDDARASGSQDRKRKSRLVLTLLLF